MENWVIAAATIVLVFVTAWYAWEARRQRKAAEKSLEELHQQGKARQEQYLKQYEAYLVPVQWLGNAQIEIANLGPGPAKDITVRAVQDANIRRSLQGSEFGLTIGQRRVVNLREAPQFSDIGEWETWVGDYVRVEIQAKTVFGKEMKTEKLLVPETKVTHL